jgi:hypothetical protein
VYSSSAHASALLGAAAALLELLAAHWAHGQGAPPPLSHWLHSPAVAPLLRPSSELSIVHVRADECVSPGSRVRLMTAVASRGAQESGGLSRRFPFRSIALAPEVAGAASRWPATPSETAGALPVSSLCYAALAAACIACRELAAVSHVDEPLQSHSAGQALDVKL